MKVAIYARYSSEKQSEGYSIETQVDACRQFLEGRGEDYEVVEYIDEAKSGSTIAGRTSLMRLMGDAANGSIDRLLVYKFDRLGRNQAEVATLVQDLEEAGVEVASATEGDDPLARGMHIVFAEHYRRQLAERTRAGNIHAAQRGHIGGPAPFGYRRGADSELQTDPETVAVAKRIFEEYRGGGSYKSIARQFNAERIPSPSGGEWRSSTIAAILKNETYIGRVIFNQREFRRNRKTGKRAYRERPSSEWIVMDRPELSIVDPGTWDAVQRRREMRAPEGSEVHRTYALSGLVECAECGHAYVAQTSSNRKGQYAYMACGARASGGTCENSFRFREDLVMQEIMRQLSDVLFTPETERALKATITRLAAERLGQKDAELQALEEQKCQCKRRIDGVMRLMLDAQVKGDATDGLWSEELAKQKTSLDALKEREAELSIGPRLDLAHLTKVVEQMIEKQRAGLVGIHEPEKIRNALRVLVGKVVAHPDGRLTYDTTPASLLEEADGRSCITLVAGAGFEPATFRL